MDGLLNISVILWSFWGVACLLIISNATAVVLNLFMLPGNWLMVGTVTLYAAFSSYGRGPGWGIVAVSASLAVLGEILETVMGSAKAARQGASRRAMLLSLVVSMAGSFLGTFLIPIPIAGTIIGAIAGAAGGAFLGAWLGEAWKGTSMERRTAIGTAALTGRMIGMAAKLMIGIVIFAIQLVAILL